MSVFIRRFLFDPGNEVLLAIESVNILDLEPPASITGIGTGTVICVGEYENGPFATGGNSSAFQPPEFPPGALEVTGTTDFVNTFGELGYRYGGVPGNNPCSVSRKADGVLAGETWNGNAFVQLNAKKFKRLLCVRVDTSVGAVTLTRQAMLTGAAAFTYSLQPSQILSLDIGAGPVNATFTATAATVNSGVGVYPTTFVGGETLTLGYDDKPNFVVTFLAADQTQAQVIARINAYAGFAFASDAGGGVTTLTGLQRGNGAQVRVVAGSALALTATNFTVAVTTGTGNVSNIAAVTFAEIRSVVTAAVAGTTVEQDSQGRLRISKIFVAVGDYIAVGPATTASALGFVVGAMSSNDGFARFRSGAETFPTLFAGGETLTLGVDNEPNVIITFTAGDQTQVQVISRINAAMGFTCAVALDATHTLFQGRANGGQVRVVAATASVLTALGLTAGTTVVATGVNTGTIPAGVVVQNTAGTRVFVAMQDVSVTALAVAGVTQSGVGPYTVKVRHALDDGTSLSAGAGSVTVLATVPDLGSFQVINPQVISAALTEAAIDAAYQSAMDTTLDLNSVAREANIIFAARQSNTVRRGLRANATQASAIGMFGRMACIRTPLGTTRALAESPVVEPGVGAYRDQRTIYCYPQASTFVPIIARRGVAGGAGFTATGVVDVGADGFMASILSQLPPEENPGQLTAFTDGVVGLESSPNAQGFTIEDYTNFRAKGIAALRIDDGTAIFQSGVTSVDPSVSPNLRNIARRRMADFIQDTLARRLKSFGKKLSTTARRKAITSEIRSFMNTLVSANNPAFQRVDSFSIDDVTGNTPTTLAQGLFRIILKVRTLASLDAIVLETTIGESVTIDVLPQAA
jgi:hypothetical protein